MQAEQAHAREASARSYGKSPSPGGRARDVPAALSSWTQQSSAVTAAPGSSPGSGFPAGTSPGHTQRRLAGFSPTAYVAPSKWFVKVLPQEHAYLFFISVQTVTVDLPPSTCAIVPHVKLFYLIRISVCTSCALSSNSTCAAGWAAWSHSIDGISVFKGHACSSREHRL